MVQLCRSSWQAASTRARDASCAGWELWRVCAVVKLCPRCIALTIMLLARKHGTDKEGTGNGTAVGRDWTGLRAPRHVDHHRTSILCSSGPSRHGFPECLQLQLASCVFGCASGFTSADWLAHPAPRVSQTDSADDSKCASRRCPPTPYPWKKPRRCGGGVWTLPHSHACTPHTAYRCGTRFMLHTRNGLWRGVAPSLEPKQTLCGGPCGGQDG